MTQQHDSKEKFIEETIAEFDKEFERVLLRLAHDGYFPSEIGRDVHAQLLVSLAAAWEEGERAGRIRNGEVLRLAAKGASYEEFAALLQVPPQETTRPDPEEAWRANKSLKAAIEKAIANGWRAPIDPDAILAGTMDCSQDHLFLTLFDHDFARAFFGSERKGWADDLEREGETDEPIGYWRIRVRRDGVWKYHLQQLALAEDRLVYIERFL